jgi:hypothetical protein
VFKPGVILMTKKYHYIPLLNLNFLGPGPSPPKAKVLLFVSHQLLLKQLLLVFKPVPPPVQVDPLYSSVDPVEVTWTIMDNPPKAKCSSLNSTTC